MNMKRITGIVVALMFLAGCINEKIEGADLKVGDVIPDFEVVMNDGSIVSDEILK